MMKFTKKNNGLLKAATNSASGTIMIGGMDQTKLDDKKDMIGVLVEEAKSKAISEAEKLIEEASIEANELIEQAQAQVNDIEQRAYTKGFEQGRQEAIEQTNIELSTILQEANLVLESIKKEREEILHEEEERIYNVVTLISRKLLERDLSINKEMSINFIKKAINQLDHRTNISISVNPEIAEQLNAIKANLIEQTPGLENLMITTDSKLNFGDIILESNRQRIDFRLSAQFEELLAEINS